MITLSEKDADSVANYARHKLEVLSESLNSSIEEKNQIMEEAMKYPLFNKDHIKELEEAKRRGIEELEKFYKSEKEQLEHIIELMMCGSGK